MKKVIPSFCLIIVCSVYCFGQKQDAEQIWAGESFESSENKISRILNLGISGSSVSQKSVSEDGSGGSLFGGVANTIGGLVNTTIQTVGDVTNSVGQTKEGAARTMGRSLGGTQISLSVEGTKTFLAGKRNLPLKEEKTFFLEINNSIEKFRNNFC